MYDVHKEIGTKGGMDMSKLQNAILAKKLQYWEEKSRTYQWPFEVAEYRIAPVILIIFVLNLCYFCTRDVARVALSVNTMLGGHQYYRIFTYSFEQASFGYLADNVLFLLIFGGLFSAKYGWKYFFPIYFGGGIAAGIGFMTVTGVYGSTARMTCGASGAIFAVVGALLIGAFVNPKVSDWKWIRVGYVSCFFVLMISHDLATTAMNTVGFATGIMMMVLLSAWDQRTRTDRRLHAEAMVRNLKEEQRKLL